MKAESFPTGQSIKSKIKWPSRKRRKFGKRERQGESKKERKKERKEEKETERKTFSRRPSQVVIVVATASTRDEGAPWHKGNCHEKKNGRTL